MLLKKKLFVIHKFTGNESISGSKTTSYLFLSRLLGDEMNPPFLSEPSSLLAGMCMKSNHNCRMKTENKSLLAFSCKVLAAQCYLN